MRVIKIKSKPLTPNQLNEISPLLEHFQHDEPRSMQLKILYYLHRYYDDYDYFVVEAQTGIGKSAIADALVRWRYNKFNEQSVIVSNRKQLIHQYYDLYNHIVFYGMNEYLCPMTPDPIDAHNTGRPVPVSDAPCKFIPNFHCPLKPILNKDGSISYPKAVADDPSNACPYYNQKYLAITSPFFVCTSLALLYNYPLIKSRHLLVWDEADSVYEDLTKYFTITLYERRYKSRYNISFDRNQLTDRSYWLDTLNHIINELTNHITTISTTISDIKQSLSDLPETSPLRKKLTNKLYRNYYIFHNLIKERGELQVLQSNLQNHRDAIIIRPSFKRYDRNLTLSNTTDLYVEFIPLTLQHINEQNLLPSLARKIVFLGATLYPELLVQQLGLDPSLVLTLKVVHHPFPPSHRQVYAVPVGKMSHNHRDNTLPDLLSAIKLILQLHQDHAGLILPNSKWLHDEIYYYLIDDSTLSDRIIIHGTTQREINSAIEQWNNHPNGVLISTYLKHGFDGSHGDFIIIPKVPFPSLTDPYFAKRRELLSYGEIEYMWYAVKDIIQMQGRCTRSPTDKSIIYILDADFIWLYRKYSPLFYDWFKEAVEFIPYDNFKLFVQAKLNQTVSNTTSNPVIPSNQ